MASPLDAQAAGGRIMESRNRVVSAPKEHGKRVTLLAMTRYGTGWAAEVVVGL